MQLIKKVDARRFRLAPRYTFSFIEEVDKKQLETTFSKFQLIKLDSSLLNILECSKVPIIINLKYRVTIMITS